MQFVTRFPNNGHLIWTASSHDLKLLEHYLKEVCHRYHTKQVSAFGTEHESTDETDERGHYLVIVNKEEGITFLERQQN